MARNVTRQALRDRIRQLSDTVGSQFVTDTELNAFIDDAVCAFYDAIVKAWGDDYFVNRVGPSDVPAGGQVSLPADFYKLRLVALYSGGQYKRLTRATDQEYLDSLNASGVEPYLYAAAGGLLFVLPAPAATGTYQYSLWYVPAAPVLSADTGATGTLDSIDGWDTYVVWKVVGDVRHKEEDPGAAAADRKAAEALARIAEMSSFRDETGVHRISLVE